MIAMLLSATLLSCSSTEDPPRTDAKASPSRTDRPARRDEGGPGGPGHFKEPLELTSKLWKTLGDDTSTPNLEQHRPDLIGTPDKIKLWMQDHPDDYS
ncbi:hypothetical protein [Streptomyces sp. NPDC058595]|uniref:hypothetical protein n=1 Tax=Streptomyces sp. NPDC058595 TaxID=3346550 RepID=UPI00364CDC8C